MKKNYLFISLVLLGALSTTAYAKTENYAEYVTLGQYTGLTVDRIIYEVTDDDVEYQIQSDLESYADYDEITDRAAELGDTVVIDFVGKVDGKEFDGGSSEDYELVLGSGDFIDGFEDQVVGMHVDTKKDIDVTFPEDYDGVLDGKKAVFTVTLKSITKVTLPELNDAFVKENTDYNSVEEYKKATKEDLQLYYDQDSTDQACYDILSLVVENSEVSSYPEDLLEDQKKSIEESNESFAEQFGMSVDDLYGDDYDIEEEAQETLKEMLVIYAIADKEGYKVSDKDIESFVESSWELYGFESEEDFKATYSTETFRYELYYEYVLDFLAANNTYKDITEEEYYGSMDDDAELIFDEDTVDLDSDIDALEFEELDGEDWEMPEDDDEELSLEDLEDLEEIETEK